MNTPAISHKILIVDDIADNRDILSRILDRKGFGVVVATNGAEAIDLAKRERPELILLDVAMPDMDGYEVCKNIKSDPDLESIPVIFISARVDSIDKLEAFNVGGVDYITKPFDFREVIARVNTHLDLRGLQIALQQKNDELSTSYQKLTELEQTRDGLVNMIVHDMRTPLSVLSTALELITLTVDDQIDDGSREDLSAAKENVAKLIAMTTDVLALSSLESNTMPLSIGMHDLYEIAANVIDEIRPLAGNHAIILNKKHGDVTIECDAECVNRIMTNLIGNALKVTPESGKVTIDVDMADDMYIIAITDTGTGIAPEHMTHIFDKFVQINRGAGRAVSGSVGLGLAYCKLATEAHQGSISVTSELGQGSTFRVYLPRRHDIPILHSPNID